MKKLSEYIYESSETSLVKKLRTKIESAFGTDIQLVSLKGRFPEWFVYVNNVNSPDDLVKLDSILKEIFPKYSEKMKADPDLYRKVKEATERGQVINGTRQGTYIYCQFNRNDILQAK